MSDKDHWETLEGTEINFKAAKIGHLKPLE